MFCFVNVHWNASSPFSPQVFSPERLLFSWDIQPYRVYGMLKPMRWLWLKWAVADISHFTAATVMYLFTWPFQSGTTDQISVVGAGVVTMSSFTMWEYESVSSASKQGEVGSIQSLSAGGSPQPTTHLGRGPPKVYIYNPSKVYWLILYYSY